MTDEERRTLCKILRTMEPWPCKQAADEIERLVTEIDELRRRLTITEIQRDDWKYDRYGTKLTPFYF